MTCHCFLYSALSVVIWFLGPYPLSPGLAISALICLDFTFHLGLDTVICNIFLVAPSSYRLCTCPNHINLFSLRKYGIGYMCASFQMSTFLTISSIVFHLGHRNMRSSVVCNLLFPSCPTAQHSAPYTMTRFRFRVRVNPNPNPDCPTFCFIHDGRFYSRLVHIVFQLCWYVPVTHHPSSFPPL